MMMLMEGIATPVITPFREDGGIDRPGFGQMLEYLISEGVHSVVVGGSTGEFYAQSLEERVEMMGLAVDAVRGRIPVMAGVSAGRTDDAVRLAEAAGDRGIDGLLLGSPPYASPTQEENALHALRIDRAARLPIMLYNYPSRTGADMGPEFLSLVSRSPRFRAIKESSGSIDRLHLLARDFPRITLVCGADDQALEFFAWGARAWVCAASNFLPAEHNALYEACVLKGDYELGRRIMKAMLPLMVALERGGKFVQGVKFGVRSTGLPGGVPRQPLRPLTEEEEGELEQVIRSLKTSVRRAVEGEGSGPGQPGLHPASNTPG